MSAPFFGKEFTFSQPDGTRLEVRGWGDQHSAVFETLDGFTIVKDPISSFYHYATATPERDEIRPVGIRVGEVDPAALGIERGIRMSDMAAKTQAAISSMLPIPHWRERRQQQQAALYSSLVEPAIVLAPPARQTVGDFKGLCLLIQFPDVPGTISRNEVDAFCNTPSYNGFGNNGSVFDYYLDNSAGKCGYTTTVAPYYTALHPRSYYTKPSVEFGSRTRELIKEALSFHKAQGFNFSGLSVDGQGFVFATNVFYAGPVVNDWAKGLWPHSSRLLAPFQLTAGKSALDYQITNMDSALTLGTYCHENGHMLCDFPDLYNYANQRAGDGVYCLMCLGGNANPTNPNQICAYLKYRAGWANPVRAITSGLTAAASAGENQFFIHTRTATEYFIIENRSQSGRDVALTDSGLAIWHIDELGSNSDPESAPLGHQRFECTLVQADGRDDLALGANFGDTTDLFRQGLNDRFGPATVPSSAWFDGTPSTLDISNIGPAGPSITFSATV